MKHNLMHPQSTKADIHVHSKFSKRPTEWILQKLGCPESFTEPLRLYRIAKQRGMTLVTITDHNMIDGCLEIARFPDTFISEEVTTYFPDDQCKVHVLVYNITEKIHRDIQAIRENIFDLVAYLNQNNIVHVLAHPLYAVNERLTGTHVEKLLLLFKNLELNGARDDVQNSCLKDICARLQPQDIVRLAEKHRIIPPFPEPWKKHLTGGSDDHSSINIGTSYTMMEGTVGIEEFLSGIETNQIQAFTRTTSPHTLAHDIYCIAYQFYKNKLHLERHADKDVLLRFMDQNLQESAEVTGGLLSRFYRFLNHKSHVKNREMAEQNVQDALRTEAYKLLLDDPHLAPAVKKRRDESYPVEKIWYYFVNKLSDTVLAQFSNYFLDHLAGANIFSIFQTIGSAGALYAVLSPYFLAFSLFTTQRQFSNKIRKQFVKSDPSTRGTAQQPNIAHFTDTYYDVNGVAITLQQQLARARTTNRKLTVITCDDEHTLDCPGVKNFKPIGVYRVPEYPNQKLCFPSLLQMLNYCYEEQFTHIHSATPGPIGLAALLIKHILKLPFSGTYHTAFPQYAQYLTGDAAIEELMWKYTLWYYAQMDCVYAPSQSTAQELQAKGINPDKIKLLPRGVDTKRFHPAKRNGYFGRVPAAPDGYKILYVGRVSKEKNLDLLAGMFKRLSRVMHNVTLVIVGDGPYLRELQDSLQGIRCIFTGYLEGEELADVYASCDLFVFPSTTDTFGNVVLEAQASGIPAVVTNAGGPQENIIPGRTGLVVEAHNEQQLFEAVHTLLSDPNRLKAMGRAARQYMESRSFDGAFDALWDMYQNQTHEQAAI